MTQIEHALQCAALAEESGAAPALIVATLLHDIGHLREDEDVSAGLIENDRHELAGAGLLSGLFGPDVCEPIALHVAAKRYLCAAEPGYSDALSEASRRSLALQGGAFDRVQSALFAQRAYSRDAIALRRFDDTGKSDRSSRRRFSDYVPLMRRIARSR